MTSNIPTVIQVLFFDQEGRTTTKSVKLRFLVYENLILIEEEEWKKNAQQKWK